MEKSQQNIDIYDNNQIRCKRYGISHNIEKLIKRNILLLSLCIKMKIYRKICKKGSNCMWDKIEKENENRKIIA